MDRRHSPRSRISAFALAAVGMGIAVVGAGVGWAAHGLVRSGPASPPVEVPRQHELPVKAAPPPPSGPSPPATRRDGGVVLEDTPLVHRFLGRSVRCGRLADADFYASVLDFLKLRTKGLASPPFHYEVRSAQRDGYEYVVVREEILKRDGSPFPGAPGYVVHTYYFDAPMSRFELASSEPEDPDFNPAMLRELGDPLGFMAMNWEAVCNGALHLHRATAAPAAPNATAPPPATTPGAPIDSGVGQWAGGGEP